MEKEPIHILLLNEELIFSLEAESETISRAFGRSFGFFRPRLTRVHTSVIPGVIHTQVSQAGLLRTNGPDSQQLEVLATFRA